MLGGAGDDTYMVDVATDIIVEAASSGTDTVSTALAPYTLGTTNGSANVENMTYTGTGTTAALRDIINDLWWPRTESMSRASTRIPPSRRIKPLPGAVRRALTAWANSLSRTTAPQTPR